MEAFKPTLEELQICMKIPQCIRNVCILAHVDHGKTTVADLLLATNLLISRRMAGLLRYLDDRPDEQERGITMKSSTVSLLNIIHDDDLNKPRKILLNLIDTPGHIDFSSEVRAAVRVCDGAIILVDAVEGVCVQTRESINRAYEEQSKMILIINKIDRLIIELGQDIDLMFQTLIKVIEDCNVVIAELYQYSFSNDVDIENTGLLFSPETGNVIFASAIDGWGFTTKQISQMVIGMVKDETVDSLNEKMWNFDCWVDSKGDIKTGAVDKQKPNIFVQLCLKTIVHIYQTLAVQMESEKAPSILKKLGITSPTREMIASNDPKTQIKSILSAWKPLSHTILLQCLKIIPSPANMEKKKIEYLLNFNHYAEDSYLNKCVEHITSYFEKPSLEPPTIAYISKMFCVDKRNLSQNTPKQSVSKRRQLKESLPEMKNLGEENSSISKRPEYENEEVTLEGKIKQVSNEIAVIALARIFTGSLKVGQEIYAMTAGYLPDENKIDKEPDSFVATNKYVNKVEVRELYMLFGKELVLVDYVPAGNFCGIGGIEYVVLRTATLSTNLDVVPLAEHPFSFPVVRYTIEPMNPKELPVLCHGLKLLIQSDSCVQAIMQETGELVILTAGAVHLDKCIEDLKNKFAKIEIHVSSPMVSLRETVTNTLNDQVQEVEIETPNISLLLTVVSLPLEIADSIKNNHELLRIIEEHQHKTLIDVIRLYNESASNENISLRPKVFKSEVMNRNVAHLREQLKRAFGLCGSQWAGLYDKIWSVGKVHDCANLLINGTEDYTENIFSEVNFEDKRTLLGQCIVNPFHSFLKAGPICEEPLMNCAFIIKKFHLVRDIQPEQITPQVVSSEESAIKSAMKSAFEKQDQRLMEPLYTTSIQVNTSILGKSLNSFLFLWVDNDK